MSAWTMHISQDGSRYRWELWREDRMLAKGTRWWDTADEAEDDYAVFVDTLEQDPPVFRQ